MRILVTGSAGFIGAAAVRLLRAEGFEVVGLDLKSVEGDSSCHLVCDLCDKPKLLSTFAELKPEIVIHLAARTDLRETSSLAGYDANISGVRNLINAVEKCGSVSRVIYASSQAVYKPGFVPTGREPYTPRTLYGESKVLTEQIVQERAGVASTWVMVRPTTIWGPGMSAHYQRMLHYIQKGYYFHVGKEPLFKSFGYVQNTAWQLLQLVRAPEHSINGKTLYLADYEPISLRRWADDFARALGAPPIRTMPKSVAKIVSKSGDALNFLGWKSFPFNSFRLRNILTEYQFDLGELREICGPLPVTYEDGILSTAEWFS